VFTRFQRLDAPSDQPAAGAGDRSELKPILLIAGLAIAVRSAYVLAVNGRDFRRLWNYDAWWYYIEANRIARWTSVAEPTFTSPSRPSALHPPLTSVVLAPVARLANGNATAMRCTIAFLGCIVVLVIGLIANEIAGRRAGLIAAFFAAIYPNLWANDGLIMSETVTTLVVAVVILALYRFIRRPSWRLVGALGVLCGLGMLNRAELALLLPMIVLPTIFLTAALTARRRLEFSGIAILFALLVISPWVIRNMTTFERPVLLSTGDGPTLVGANCSTTYGGPLLGYWNAACGLPGPSRGADESVVGSRQRRLAIDYMTDHPKGLVRASVARVGRLWSLYRPLQMADLAEREGRPNAVSIAGLVFFYLFCPLAFVGAVVLRRRRVALLPLLGQFLLVTLTAAAFYGKVRFRTPAEVSIVVLVAIALDAWAGRRSRAGPPRRSVHREQSGPQQLVSGHSSTPR
jgi:hypothetical protein